MIDLLESHGALVGDDLLEEVLSKNHVTVQVHRASVEGGKLVHRLVEEMQAQGAATIHALHQQDKYRMLLGHKAIYWPELLRRLGLDERALILRDVAPSVRPNLRTNAGADFVYANLFGTQVAIADYIGLSNNTFTPAATDTATTIAPWNAQQTTNAAGSGTTGEWTALGLSRAQVTTNTHSAGSATVTLAKTWTATGAATGTRAAALYGGTGKTAWAASGSGTLTLENTFTATDLATNDQLTLTWTITI